MEYICTECGRGFEVTTIKLWTYKTCASFNCLQCSYTCYDHAMLRKEKNTGRIRNWEYEMRRCEETMIHQKKKIRRPLIIKNEKEFED